MDVKYFLKRKRRVVYFFLDKWQIKTKIILNIHYTSNRDARGIAMLQLTRDGEYAVRAMLFLASQPEGKVSLISEISENQAIPKSYLSKIMQHLARSELVRSRRGANGGVVLALPASEITLREIIEAVAGPIHLNICLLRKGECPNNGSCSITPLWEEAQRRFIEVLESKTMAQLAEEAEAIHKKAKKAHLSKKRH